MRTALFLLAAIAAALAMTLVYQSPEAHTGAAIHSHDHGVTFHSHTTFGEHEHAQH